MRLVPAKKNEAALFDPRAKVINEHFALLVSSPALHQLLLLGLVRAQDGRLGAWGKLRLRRLLDRKRSLRRCQSTGQKILNLTVQSIVKTESVEQVGLHVSSRLATSVVNCFPGFTSSHEALHTSLVRLL